MRQPRPPRQTERQKRSRAYEEEWHEYRRRAARRRVVERSCAPGASAVQPSCALSTWLLVPATHSSPRRATSHSVSVLMKIFSATLSAPNARSSAIPTNFIPCKWIFRQRGKLEIGGRGV